MSKPIFSIIIYFLAQVIALYLTWNLANQSEIEISNELGFGLIISTLTTGFGLILIRWQVLNQAKQLQSETSIKPWQNAVFTIIPIFGIYQNYKNQELTYQISKNYFKNNLFIQLAGVLAILQVIFIVITVLRSAVFLELPILVLNILLDCYLMWKVLISQDKHFQDSKK